MGIAFLITGISLLTKKGTTNKAASSQARPPVFSDDSVHHIAHSDDYQADTNGGTVRYGGSKAMPIYRRTANVKDRTGNGFYKTLRTSLRTDDVELPESCHEVIESTSSRRFILAWFFFEQLTMSTTNLFSLAWYAKMWNARTVMPFTYNSQMFGLPKLHSWRGKLKSLHTLNLLYDNQKLNKLLCKHKIPPLVDFQEFMSESSKHVVVIHLLYYNSDMARLSHIGGSRAELFKAMHNHHAIECCSIQYIGRIVNVLGTYLNRESKLAEENSFQVHRCVCVNASLSNEPSDLLKMIGLHNSDEFSVFITDWRGISNSAAPKKAVQGVVKNFRMLVPSSKLTFWPHPGYVVFPISTYVRGNATKFINRAAHGRRFVAIHFRSEKLGQAQARISNFANMCFDKAMRLRDQILFTEKDLVTFYFTDYGAYGSTTCHNTCRGARKISSLLSAQSIQVTHFSPKKYKAVADSGFVALVEQEVMASAHTLILVGGGSFQTQVHKRFKKYNSEGTVYRICWDDRASVDRM